MGQPLRTEAEAMFSSAANFDTIATQLTTAMNNVGNSAAALATQLHSEQAGMAAQRALTQYEEAARKQTQLLTDISHNIQQGGHQYVTADIDGSDGINQVAANLVPGH
jgi:hypothetical protein